MKILVGYKRVVDYNVRIQVKPDGSGVVTDGVKLSANPFDDIALEEALRLRDKGIATEVIVATIGPADCQAHLRNGLAMGANRAIHVVTDQRDPAADRRARDAQAGREGTARPRDPGQAGHRRRRQPDRPDAGHAVGPPAGDVRRASSRSPTSKATVTREVDAGLETLEVDLPGGDHHRPAPQRAALHQAAGHHEGQEQAAWKRSRSPISAWSPATTLTTTHYAPPRQAQQGRDGEGRRPSWSRH